MAPFNSAMPAWETGLSETERWQVIAYIRSLGSGDGHMDDNHMDDDGHMEDDHSN